MPAFGPCRRACGCAGLFFLPPDSAVLPVFAALLFAPSFFPSSVFLLPARISLCPHFPLPVFLSARVSLCPHLPFARVSLSPHLPSFVGSSSVVCIPSGFSSVISCFSVHRPSLAVCCCPLSIPCCPLSIPCRLLSIARCAVHRSSPVVCCPSPIVYPLLPVARNLPPAVHRLLRRPYPVAFICTPSPRRASFRCRSVRITAFVSAESRPACLRELLAVSFRSGFRRSVFPQKCVRPPYLGRRAVSDKITHCILLSGAIFPARPAILLTIWQRLPFGTTFVQIQGVTGAPDPQGGRIPAARKENGKNINN